MYLYNNAESAIRKHMQSIFNIPTLWNVALTGSCVELMKYIYKYYVPVTRLMNILDTYPKKNVYTVAHWYKPNHIESRTNTYK